MATQDRFPTSDSFNQGGAWSASSGTILYDMVDETPADDDSTYVYSAGSFKNLRFGFLAFNITSTAIDKLTVTSRDRYTGSADTMANVIKVGGTSYNSATFNPTTIYQDFATDWLTNPRTGAAWTEADIEGTGPNPLQEIGIYVNGIPSTPRCTRLYVTVTYSVTGGLSIPVAMYHYNLMRG